MSSHPTETVVSRRLLYLRALQAALPSALEIIDDAPHVAIYRFISDQKQWVRMNVEGSAYITRNAEAPFYSLVVLNKKGEDDFVFHLQKIEKLRMQENYLMLRCHREPQETEQIIYGIWIHSDAERERIFNSISGVLSKSAASNPSAFLSKLNNLRASPSVTTQPPAPVPVPTNNNNVITAANQKSIALLSVLKKSQQINNNGNGSTAPIAGSNSSPPAVSAAEEEKKASHVSPATSLNAASALLAAIKPPQNTQTQVPSAASNTAGLRANESASAKLLSVLKASPVNPSEQPPVAPSVNKGTMLLSALKKERETPTNVPAERDLCDLLTDAQIASRVKSQQTPQPPKPPVSVNTPLTQVGSPSVSTHKKEQNMSNLQSPSKTTNKSERPTNEKKNVPPPSAPPSQTTQSVQKDKSTLKALLISPSMLEG